VNRSALIAISVAVSASAAPTDEADIARLRLRALLVPVQSVSVSELQDTYLQGRGNGSRVHEAIDISARQGTPVVAVEDGKIAKLFWSKPGGRTIYQFDPASEFAYYYAHLDAYADGLREGMPLRKGQLVGYVGISGNASPSSPHLHFAIFRLGVDKKWWEGTPINPFSVLAGER